MTRFERAFDATCARFRLNPSRWIPHIKTEGIYEMGTAYDSAEEMLGPDGELRDGTPVPVECFSIYGAFWTICFTRRQNKALIGMVPEELPEPSRWENLWSFLSDVDLGIYDTETWEEPVEVNSENP